MSRFTDLTTEQVYASLEKMKANRRIAREQEATGLVESLQSYIDNLIEILIERNTDPHTTSADIRYYENQDE